MSNKSKLKYGIVVTFIAKYSNIICQLIINSVLARLLMPEEFGIVAIITVFISFFNILGDMGIGPAIIQNKTLKAKEISDIFKFSIFAALVISILFYFFSYIIAFFYTNKIYIRLGSLLTLTVFFSICNIVPNALIYKNQNFKIAGIINISVNIIIGLITISLASKGWSYYSLIFDSILKSILIFILSFIYCGIRINKGFSYNSVKKIQNYSVYQFSFNFINYFTRNSDNIMVGKFLGSSTLGYYDKAYKLMLYPIQNLTNVITPVLQPVLSEYQDDKEIIYDVYMKVIKVLSYIGIFVTVYCFNTSSEIINIMYGSNWDESIPIFKVLSLSIVIQMVLSSIGSIFQSTGYVNKLFHTGMVSAGFTITAITIGIFSGSVEVLAFGIVIAFALNFLQCFYVLITEVFKKNFISFLMELKNVVIIGAVMTLGYILTAKIIFTNIVISALVKLIIGIISYSISLIITKEYKLLKSLLIK